MKGSIIICCLVLLAGCGNQSGRQSATLRDSLPATGSGASLQPGLGRLDSMWITIMLPVNMDQYREAMTAYTQEGGANPSLTWHFEPRRVKVPAISDTLSACAAAAAAACSTQGDSVVYFKLCGRTAYILLEMDVDGWAGVSVTIDRVHPVVRRTLLQSKEVDSVLFGKEKEGDNKD